jgi:hypothetical protein
MRCVKYSVFSILCLIIVPVTAQESELDFLGTWELLSIEERTETGDWAQIRIPGGGRPVGIIMYDEHGTMAVQITTDPRTTETPAENPELVNGYIAYYATYEVDANAGTITHHRRSHVNSDLANLSVVRYFSFLGNTLTLTVAPEQSLRLNWVKMD